jgi:CRP/FNR family nitrogen fixation transcriptional regulator
LRSRIGAACIMFRKEAVANMHGIPSPNSLTNSRHAMPSTPHPLQSLDAIAAITPCHRRQEICRQGQAANTWYCVLAGAALRCVIKSDGRRQVVDLLFPGDFFGLTARGEYDYTVEAATPGTIVAGYPRKRVETQADSNPQLARELRQIAFDGLSRLQEQLLILGRITAQEKVGSFIVAMADRLSDGRSDRVTLPISRYDIADYLAVSVETVSRALSELKHRGLIRFAGTRVIQIIDRDALEDGEHDDMPERTPALAERVSPQLSSASFARTASRTASAN